MNQRGNTLVYMLLGLAVAVMVGLCFAPLTLRPCGHRGSLVDRGFSGWKPHDCAASPMLVDLYSYDGGRDGGMEDAFPNKSLTYYRTGMGGYTFAARFTNHQWQMSVDRAPDLPGWYLLTSDGRVHFNEKAPATEKDFVLPNLPAP